MKALAFLILSLPFFSWAHPASVQAINPTEDQTLDFDFGQVPVGDTYYTFFTLTAPDDHDIKITKMAITGDSYEYSTECGDTLAAGDNCDTEVDFTPTAVGEQLGQLAITTDLDNVFVNLKGEGVEPSSN